MIYSKSTDNTARFALGSIGSNTLVVFGVNPSTATDQVFDNTIRRIEGYSRVHGFDGWLMLNLYPQRSTDPRGLHTEIDLALHAENMMHIAEVLALAQNFTLCAAWGQVIRERNYLKNCLECINASIDGHEWHSIGQATKEGHPRHPLYVKTTAPLEKFSIQEYLEQITVDNSRI